MLTQLSLIINETCLSQQKPLEKLLSTRNRAQYFQYEGHWSVEKYNPEKYQI